MILVGVVVVVVVLVVAAASAQLTHMARHRTSKHIIHQLGGETSDMRRDVMMINGYHYYFICGYTSFFDRVLQM